MHSESSLISVSRRGDENSSPGRTAPGGEEGAVMAFVVGSLVTCVWGHDSEHSNVGTCNQSTGTHYVSSI